MKSIEGLGLGRVSAFTLELHVIGIQIRVNGAIELVWRTTCVMPRLAKPSDKWLS